MARSTRRHALVTAAVLTLLFMGSGCTAQKEKLNVAGAVAEAGVAFTNQIPELYNEYFALYVEVNSIALSQERDDQREIVDAGGASEADAKSALREHLESSNRNLLETLDHLRQAKRHALFLRNYFVGLQAFVSDETGGGTGAALANVTGHLRELKPGLLSAADSLLGAGAGGFERLLTSLAEIAVTAVKSARLRDELAKNGPAVREAIYLQERLVEEAGRQMIEDLKSKAAIELEEPLLVDYMSLSGSLPGDWTRRRVELLNHQVRAEAVERATAAASTLRLSWEQLMAGSVTGFTVGTLVADIEATIKLIEELRGT